MEKLRAKGMTDDEIRRLFEAELSGARDEVRLKPDTTKKGASGG
jgi:hypothetical protein